MEQILNYRDISFSSGTDMMLFGIGFTGIFLIFLFYSLYGLTKNVKDIKEKSFIQFS